MAYAVASPGVAYADCSGAGDFGAGSGCPPPGDTSGAGGGDSWPPTAVDWPPSQSANPGPGEGAGAKEDAGPPIVLPAGQQPAPPRTATPAKDPSPTPTSPPPIVPVGPVTAEPASAAIASPASPIG